MYMDLPLDRDLRRETVEEAYLRKLAFVYHLKISDLNGYDEWLKEGQNSFGCKRLFRVKTDPVARKGKFTAMPGWNVP